MYRRIIRPRIPFRAVSYRSYRIAMPVTDAVSYPRDGIYPVCPRCRLSLSREYQRYCDRCGQALGWEQWDGED